MLNENRDFVLDFALTRNKAFSIQLSWWPKEHSDLCFRFRASTKGGHAGVNMSWQIARVMFDVNLYDRRHWDYENDRWHDPRMKTDNP
jgi:hypothetical protein